MDIKIGFVCIATTIFDDSYAKEIYPDICQKLGELDKDITFVTPDKPVGDEKELYKVISELQVNNIDALLLQMGTFSTGIMPVRLCQAFEVPLALWALKEPSLEKKVPINSLCGVNLVSSSLNSLNRDYKYFYSSPEEDSVYENIRTYIRSVKAAVMMEKAQIGYMGGRAIGFYPCLFDEMKLRRTFGTEVLTVGLNEIKNYKVTEEDIDKNTIDPGQYPTIDGKQLTKRKIIDQEKAFRTLKKLVVDKGFDALTIRDWPELMDDNDFGAIWPAIGKLHDEVLVTGAEGDMPGTITMMIEEYLTGEKPFLCDMVYVDEDRNTITLWHYGGAPSLACDSVKYCHDNQDVEFTLCPGPITIARLAETENGYKMLIGEGEVLSKEVTLRRAGAEVKFVSPVKDFLDEIIYGGWAHHICTIEGDYKDTLLEFCNLMNIDTVVF